MLETNISRQSFPIVLIYLTMSRSLNLKTIYLDLKNYSFSHNYELHKQVETVLSVKIQLTLLMKLSVQYCIFLYRHCNVEY